MLRDRQFVPHSTRGGAATLHQLDLSRYWKRGSQCRGSVGDSLVTPVPPFLVLLPVWEREGLFSLHGVLPAPLLPPHCPSSSQADLTHPTAWGVALPVRTPHTASPSRAARSPIRAPTDAYLRMELLLRAGMAVLTAVPTVTPRGLSPLVTVLHTRTGRRPRTGRANPVCSASGSQHGGQKVSEPTVAMLPSGAQREQGELECLLPQTLLHQS